jgi:hypothetical protein
MYSWAAGGRRRSRRRDADLVADVAHAVDPRDPSVEGVLEPRLADRPLEEDGPVLHRDLHAVEDAVARLAEDRFGHRLLDLHVRKGLRAHHQAALDALRHLSRGPLRVTPGVHGQGEALEDHHSVLHRDLDVPPLLEPGLGQAILHPPLQVDVGSQRGHRDQQCAGPQQARQPLHRPPLPRHGSSSCPLTPSGSLR